MQKNPEWYHSCHKSSVRKQWASMPAFWNPRLLPLKDIVVCINVFSVVLKLLHTRSFETLFPYLGRKRNKNADEIPGKQPEAVIVYDRIVVDTRGLSGPCRMGVWLPWQPHKRERGGSLILNVFSQTTSSYRRVNISVISSRRFCAWIQINSKVNSDHFLLPQSYLSAYIATLISS